MPLRVACAVALGMFIGCYFRIAHDAGMNAISRAGG